jgi:homoserine kinase
MMQKVTVSIPATTANLGPGFDCLGMALNLRQDVTFTAQPSPGLCITASGEDADMIPREASNLVFQAAEMVFNHLDWRSPGLHIEQRNRIPIGSGLGSSSSAVLAGMFGANALAGSPLTKREILQMATDLEGHPDNVAPAVYGGLVLGVQAPDGLFVEEITIAPLHVAVILPDYQLLTNAARAALPSQVAMKNAIFNTSRIGLLIRALESGDYEKLHVAMEDRLHQPYRIPLIPGMKEAFAAAREAGAAGVALSGAGPGLIAFAGERHQEIRYAASDAFSQAGLSSRTWVLTVDTRGLVISDE